MFPARGVAVTVLLASVAAVPLPAAGPKTEEIVARAVAYVAGFVGHFTSIVAEERFVQDSRHLGGPKNGQKPPKGTAAGGQMVATGVTMHRELASDYLLVKLPALASWYSFRDVFEVDGRPVRDRSERLADLFLQPSEAMPAKAAAIEREGVRYNLGDPERTLNNPLLVLGFLQPQYQARFRFSLRDRDPEVGPDVWVVEYREQMRPTLIRKIPDGDLPARGRVWIDQGTGRILKTELTVSEDDEITTSFRFDERFQLALPVEMRESYWYGSQYVTGGARYDRYRQFGVQTEEQIDTTRIP